MTGTDDLIRGFKALDAARDAYLDSWAYYAGTLPERFASERIQQLVEKSAATHYRFRFAKVPVRVMKDRVQVANVTGATDEITSRIDLIRRANDMDMLEPFLHERVFALGDAYALTWPVEFDDEEQPERLREAGVAVTYQSPLSCRAVYDAEDGLRLRYVIRRWKEATPLGDAWRAELYYPDGRIEPWACEPGADGHDPIQWKPDDEDEPGAWPLFHEYGIPIHHARNDMPYGRPEHADAMGPQDALTKAILTQVVVDLEAHGWRERWELLDTNPDTARDSVQWADDTKAPAVAAQTSRKSGPGTVHILEGRKGTGEYAAPNPAEIPPVTDQWLRFLSVVSGTPAYEYDPERNAGLSGIARMWADKPLAAREKNAKRYLLRFYRDLWAKALQMVGYTDPGPIEVEWQRPEPIADPDWWGVASARREHGVPQKQILLEAGYAPDEVDEWLDENDEARTLLERITLVEKLGTALQSLGSAVALGAIDQAKVDTLVSRILGERVVEPEQETPEPRPALPAAPVQVAPAGGQ